MTCRTGFKFQLLLVVALMVLTACGGSSKPASTTSTAAPASGGTAPKADAKPADSGSAKMSPELQQLYEKAKAEGSVNFWSPEDVAHARQMIADFNKTFPGVEIKHVEIEPAQSVERAVSEAQAGKLSADVVDSTLSALPPLLDRDLLQSFDYPKVFGHDPSLVYFNNRVATIYHLDMPITYNTNLVKPADLPKSYDDLLDPKWKGKVIVESRGYGFSVLTQTWGEAKTQEFLKNLVANKPIIAKGGSTAVEMLEGGQGAFAIGTYSYKIMRDKQKGAPVEYVRVGPVPAMIKVVGAFKGGPHPNAALLWAGWLSSKDGRASRFRANGEGLVTGSDLNPTGEDYKKNNMQVFLETQDIPTGAKTLAAVGKTISGK